MCAFCEIAKNGNFDLSFEHFFTVYDRAPVTKGHALVISKVHREDFLALTKREWPDLWHAIRRTISQIDHNHTGVQGYNIGTNMGEVAGQTVMHFHVHIIPRRLGDVANPRGGVRNIMKPLVELLPE
jgi:diadenosine tetraphosphate (Ap4A) HIT family hydrolase